jgi:hypothetical protein
MNHNKLDIKNKNTNLYCIFYILFIRNQRKTTKKLISEKIPFPTVFISTTISRIWQKHERVTSSFLVQ